MTRDIDVITHSAIEISEGERHYYIDPFQIRREPHNADIIFITHDHHDHFSPEDIEKVADPEKTLLVVPGKMLETARKAEASVNFITTVMPYMDYEFGGVAVETVPAYNIGKPFHPKEAYWVGYILNVGGRRVYIAGDTDLTAETLNVNCDVALVPVGGGYTMDAAVAARLVNTIRPKVAIPIHYGSVVGNKWDAEIFREHVDPEIKVEIKMMY